jgi:hypothetical protein
MLQGFDLGGESSGDSLLLVFGQIVSAVKRALKCANVDMSAATSVGHPAGRSTG